MGAGIVNRLIITLMGFHLTKLLGITAVPLTEHDRFVTVIL